MCLLVLKFCYILPFCPQVWLTDKDAAERSAIREQFPGTRQFICTFHVLQAFRREVQPLLKGHSRQERDDVLRTLEGLAYASSEADYWRIRASIGGRVDRYLRENWDAIRNEWVRGLAGGHMAGVFTNNHLESLHAKMKSVNNPHDSFEKFVEGYKVVLSAIRTERNKKIFSETQKRPTHIHHGDLGDVQKTVTTLAFDLIKEQLEVVERGEHDAMGQCDELTCDCAFFRQYTLPCQHIIAHRRAQAIAPLFSDEVLPERWRLSFLSRHLQAQVLPAPPPQDVDLRSLPRRERPRTENERFRELRNVTQLIASAGAECTGQQYNDLYASLRQVLDCVRRGQAFCVVSQVEDMAPDAELIQPAEDAGHDDLGMDFSQGGGASVPAPDGQEEVNQVEDMAPDAELIQPAEDAGHDDLGMDFSQGGGASVPAPDGQDEHGGTPAESFFSPVIGRFVSPIVGRRLAVRVPGVAGVARLPPVHVEPVPSPTPSREAPSTHSVQLVAEDEHRLSPSPQVPSSSRMPESRPVRPAREMPNFVPMPDLSPLADRHRRPARQMPTFKLTLPGLSPLSDHEYAQSPDRRYQPSTPQVPDRRLSPVDEEEEGDDGFESTPRTSGAAVWPRRNIWPADGGSVSGTLPPVPGSSRSGAAADLSGLRMPMRIKARGRPKGPRKTVVGARRRSPL